MFEYEGAQHTYEDLQKEAARRGIALSVFIKKMKKLGMTLVKDSSKEQSKPTSSIVEQSLNLDMSSQQAFEQDEEVQERGALDVLKSYGANLGIGTVSIADNFTKLYETGEGGFLSEVLFENPFVASYGYAAEFLRNKGYDIPDEFLGTDLTTPGMRREIYENHMLDAKEKGLTLEQAQKLDPTNTIKFEKTLDWFSKHTYTYKDENGDPMDYLGLFSEAESAGDYAKVVDAFVNDAFGSVPSLVVSRLPYGSGAAILGAGAYMDNFEREMYKRGFDDEVTRNQVMKDSFITGSSDFVMELLGGRILNNIIGKGLGKQASKDLLTNIPKVIAKKFLLGYTSEFTTEGLTGVLQTKSKNWSYGDVVTYKQYLRTFFKDGFLGGFLGGGTTLMSTPQKRQIHDYLSPETYKQEQLKVEKEIVGLMVDADKAEGKNKEILEEKIQELQDKKDANQNILYGWFDSLTKAEKVEYADNVDGQHKNLDIIGNPEHSEATQKAAKKEHKKYTDANSKFFAGIDIDYDADLEQIIGRTLKASERIQEQKGVFGFNKKNLDIEYVDSEKRLEELNAKFEGFDKADGMFVDNSGGKSKIYINQQVAALTGATNVIGHEYLHAIVSQSFSEGIGAANLKGATKSFVEYLKSTGKDGDRIIKRIEDRLANKYNGRDAKGDIIRDSNGLVKTKNKADQEEYFNLFSDIIKEEKVESVEAKSAGIKNSFRALFRGLGFGEVDFQSGQEVFDFLVDYNTNMKRSSILGKLTSKRIAKVKMKGLEAKADKRFKGGTDALFSPNSSSSVVRENSETNTNKKSLSQGADSKPQVDDLGKMGWNDKTWKDSGANFALETMKDEKLLDALIYAKYKVEDVPADFVDLVYAELVPDIQKFNEKKWGTKDENDSLFGYLQGRIKFRAGDVYNREFKVDEAMKGAKDSDAKGKEGEVKLQVAAETDSAIEALETEDLSPAAQAKKKADKAKGKQKVESKFRRQLGIKTGGDLYNKVLDTARKSLLRAYEAGTSVRNIQRKLRDEANVYLFKDVKNFLGTKDYIKRLKEFRVPIMNSIFTADLVQLERNTPEGEKVFTRFVKKLTSKEDVQAAVDQNLLPASALNIIDKGTAVSLYEKRNPTEAQFMSYFDIPTINPKTGARSGTRGTRKDQLAKYMAGSLSYDATMEVAQETEIAQKRADLAGLRGESLAKDNLEVLAAAIGRDPSVKFSFNDANDGNNILEGKNKGDGYGGKNWQKFIDNPSIENRTKYEVIDEYLERHTEQNDAISNKELAKLDRTDPKRDGSYTGKKRPTKIRTYKKYEMIAKDRAKKLIKDLGLSKEGYKVESLSEKDNNPDIRITRNGKTVLAIEIKGNTARGVSISFNYKKDGKGLTKGKSAAAKQETENYTKKEKALIKDSNKVFDKMIAFVGKDQITYSPQGNLQISVEGVKNLKEKGLHLEIYKNKYFITTSDVANSYKQKKGKDGSSRTSHVIEMGNAGMYSMDNSAELSIEGLKNFSDQKALIPLTARIGFGSVNKAGTHRTVSIRMEPQLNSMFFDKQNISLINKQGNKNINFKSSKSQQTSVAQDIIKAANKARTTAHFSKTNGASIFDFDETVGISENFIIAKKGNVTQKIASNEWPLVGETLKEQGYEFDFTDFNKVTKGKPGPLLQKMKNQIEKYGPKNVFILTARAPESQTAIHEWLESEGVNIPIENITGLGNSTGQAKAAWVLDKYANNNYNDIYFVDDALQNVKAVRKMLDQLDVKGKSVQAKIKFSKSMNDQFNDILETVTGIDSVKRFSQIKGRKRGDNKGKFRFFIPPSHEDFVGLLYNFMGKGKEGDKHRNFFEQALVRPLNRAYKEIDTAKQAIANDYKALNEQFPEIKKKLVKTTPDGDFTFQDAIRVYLWNKHSHKIPGLTETDQATLVALVQSDAQLQAYAETLNVISKQENYVDPGQSWETGNIRIDLVDATGRVGRAAYFSEFNENADTLFSEENLNKIEAGYGRDFREALEDMLHRVKTGVNRPKGASAKPNMFMNWLNASVSGVMFFNTRSALLQQLSNVNYLNFADNNIFAAGKAFANQPQYWKDFAMIFNSDMMKQRRGGLGTDINGAELAEAIKKARPDNTFDQVSIIIGQALKAGFTLTQIGDNIAIATGGSAFYRNKVNKYIKDGMSQKEAEAAAFTDFQNVTQSTQQSARPDMTSQQQASWIGKLVLNFLNTPSQYNRIIKKAGSDLLNKRITPPNETLMQSNMSNMSRMLYYGAAQNLIFYSLQTALFAVMFDDEDDEESEAFLKKKERIINGTLDTLLRGSGIYGVAVSTLKNMTIKFLEQREKGYNKDESAVIMEMLNFSPVVGIKARKIVNAEKTLNYNKKVIDEMDTFDIDNPQWSAVTNYVEAITTTPVNRIYQKTINVRNAADNEYTAFQRALFLSGYTTWSLDLGDTKKMEEIKAKIKNKKQKKKKKNTMSREEIRLENIRNRTR